MKDGVIYTIKTTPNYYGKHITLGEIMDDGDVDEKYFIPEEKLYYTSPDVTHSDETHGRLSKEARQTWQYLKGAKKLPRKAANGHEYIFQKAQLLWLMHMINLQEPCLLLKGDSAEQPIS